MLTLEDTHAENRMVSTSCPPRKSVLVIDDEPLMCELLCSLLGDDYRMQAQQQARAALEQLVEGEGFDVVLCDLTMPQLSGMDLHAELSKRRPDQAARMIFMTGGSFTDRAAAFLDALPDPPLMKPFRDDQVRAAIEERLSRLGPITRRAQRAVG